MEILLGVMRIYIILPNATTPFLFCFVISANSGILFWISYFYGCSEFCYNKIVECCMAASANHMVAWDMEYIDVPCMATTDRRMRLLYLVFSVIFFYVTPFFFIWLIIFETEWVLYCLFWKKKLKYNLISDLFYDIFKWIQRGHCVVNGMVWHGMGKYWCRGMFDGLGEIFTF